MKTIHIPTPRYDVEFSKATGYRFIVTKPNVAMHYFVRSERGLYFLDTATRDAVLINTVTENKSRYSNRDYARAVCTRTVQDIIGRPGIKDYLKILEGGFRNCDARLKDAW